MQEESILVGYIERAVDSASRNDPDGKDSFSPTAVVTKADGVTTITVTDKNGTTSAQVLDGVPGEAGARGAQGKQGTRGADGVSPSVIVSKTDGVTTITATDKDGTTSAQVLDGHKGDPGEKGADGFSPTVTVNKVGDATTVTVTDRNGTTTAQILNGRPGDKGDPGERGEKGAPGDKGDPGPAGAKGADGFSPTVAVNKVGGVTTITVTDKDGTTTAQILDGVGGEKGDTADLTRIEADIDALETQQTEQAAVISAAAEGVALNRSTLGYQRKNLLKNIATSRVNNGITYTVNEDGSITADGTATANSTFILIYVRDLNDKELITGRKVILTGCPSGGGSGVYRVQCYRGTSNAVADYGSGVEFTFDASGMADNANFAIVITRGTIVNNLKFYPMLRYAEIADDTYEPYKPSVKERLAALEEKLAVLVGNQTDNAQ